MNRALLLLAGILLSPGCFVLSLNPAYEAHALVWDAALLGVWEETDDGASLAIERGEWKSYRIRYAHRVETGTLTGYLTAIGEDRYLDVMPARGADRGSFLVPAHAIVRVRIDGDHLELTPISYDWLRDRLHGGAPMPGLDAVLDQKDNALIVSPTDAIRAWLGSQPEDGALFGAPAVFTRKRVH